MSDASTTQPDLSIHTFPLGAWQTNCYVVAVGKSCWIVDAGFEPSPMLDFIDEHGLSVEQVVLTHAHLDHGGGNLSTFTGKSVASGQTKTFADAFSVTEMDVDENITLTIENSPGSWVKIENVRKSTGMATGWLGDLVVSGAVCPSSAPYNYSLKVKASDGALFQEKSFVLVVSGCE